MPLTCPDCAKLIQPTWRRCPHCGQPLTAATAPVRLAPPLPSWLMPAAALLALLFIALLFVAH